VGRHILLDEVDLEVVMMKRIELFPAGFRGKRWAFRFVAGNGEIIAQSETYKNKLDAKTTAIAVATQFVEAEIEEVTR
jgi:uncharacterized protein YegP (UPF0339 family)